jgi:hypothetical protein
MQLGLNITNTNAPGTVTTGGMVTIKSLKALQEEQRTKAQEQNSQPVVQALAGFIRKTWMSSMMAKQQTSEIKMLKSVRARRGEYDPDKLAQLREQGSSTIYMMLTSNKCRAASSWLRDTLVTASDEKPWTIKPGAIPDLPPSQVESIMAQAQQEVMQLYAAGQPPTDQQVRERLLEMKDMAMSHLKDMAGRTAERMEVKMTDQLQEGNWSKAFSDFLDDITTFPAAFIKGPVVRKRPKMQWVPGQNGDYQLDVQDELCLEWERVDPFNLYPAADASTVDDGALIERHKLARADLQALIGVDGYSDGAIRMVLEEYGKGGLRDWIYVDMNKAAAEGKSTMGVQQNPSQLIDALQYWGNVQGQLLRDWGMTEEEVPDPLMDYPIEAWVIGTWVIKAVINPDPLGRKPYYKASYEEVPGAYWGNSVADLCRDAQDICNAAARALVNNMSIASGPQVVYNIDRLPQGENITQMYPWKVWQVTSDPMAGGAAPMQFFQPSSLSGELMAVYEKFSTLADEYTGIPKYMTGDSAAGGAGRTASGMSMMMSNAGKSIKQVIANIDENVIRLAIERLYFYNMRYGDDPDLKGDVNIVARGATSLLVKEQAQMRQNQFLQIALSNPITQQIVGVEGIAELLRQSAKTLDLNPDNIVPPVEIIKARMAQQAQQAQAAQQQQLALEQQNGQAQAGGTPPNARPGATLETGAPVTNNFAPLQGVGS